MIDMLTYLAMTLGIASMALAVIGFAVRKKTKSTIVATIITLSFLSCAALTICVLEALKVSLSSDTSFAFDTIYGWVIVVTGVSVLSLVFNAASLFAIAKRG